ncbi:hypothetical protein VNO78_21857 [Psophocarpus tetragonolobus]|uniref:Uncharacterized protein n=1 Tax=Psophocarpus tetragonolobus TaxID=3891 RepID=A0AAN9SDW4_PSOTE
MEATRQCACLFLLSKGMTLETADGKCVIIGDFVNEQCTFENGFTRGVENSIFNSLASQKGDPGDYELSFPLNERNLSKEMGGVKVACSSGGKRHSTRLHGVKVCRRSRLVLEVFRSIQIMRTILQWHWRIVMQRDGKRPETTIQSQLKSEYSNDALGKDVVLGCTILKYAGRRSRLVLEHPDNGVNSISGALENCDEERQKRQAAPIQSQLRSEYSNDLDILIAIAGVENCIPTSLASQKEVLGVHEKSSRGGPPKHPDNENSASASLENSDVEGLKSHATPIQFSRVVGFQKIQIWYVASTSLRVLVQSSNQIPIYNGVCVSLISPCRGSSPPSLSSRNSSSGFKFSVNHEIASRLETLTNNIVASGNNSRNFHGGAEEEDALNAEYNWLDLSNFL